MRDVNKTMLVGRVGNVDFRNNGVVSMTLATNSYFKDKDGETKNRAEWHRLVCFEKLGSVIKDYEIGKGSRIMIEGTIKSSVWKDKEGVEKKTTEIICNNLEVLATKKAKEEKQKVESQPRQYAEDGGTYPEY